MIKADDIAQGLKNALDEGAPAETSIQRLVGYLKAHGLLALLPSILSAYTRIESRAKQKKSLLTVATSDDAELYLQQIKSISPDETIVRVDKTIIGGYVLKQDSKRVDASHKGALLNLYHKIASPNDNVA